MKKFLDLNKVSPDDEKYISGWERFKSHVIDISDSDTYELYLELYIIRLHYKDGSYRDIRAFCEPGISQNLTKEEQEDFFFKSLFGANGLIAKDSRNDYLYLGGLNKSANKDKYPTSRYNKAEDGQSINDKFVKYLNNTISNKLTLSNMTEDYDVFNMDFYFHCGNEDMDEVFTNGLRSEYGNNGYDGFAHLTSTFYSLIPKYVILNNLYDAARCYNKHASSLGSKCFVLRIPREYLADPAYKSSNHPLPNHKMVNYKTGDCYIIPELIYGMYDSDTGVFHRNPNYNIKYNPAGLVFDQYTADNVKNTHPEIYDFMYSRREIPYQKLKNLDTWNRQIEELCRYYNIDRTKEGLKKITDLFKRRR